MSGSLQEQPSQPVTRAQQLAGGLIFFKGLIGVAERMMLPETILFRLSGQGGPVVIVDVLLGAVLLAGKRGVVEMALLKFALELVLIVNVRMQQGEYLLAGARVAVCLALLLLLLRGAGRVRIAVAILLFAAYLGVEALALTEALVWLAE